MPSDDQILIPAGAETRAELLESIRSLLRTGRIASASADPLRALSPSINDDGDILIRLALRGDLNYDGVLDGDDYFEMDRAFLMQNPLKPQADLTLDGRVDAEDFFILDKAFLTLSRPPVAAGVAAATEWEELDDLAEVLR